MTLAGAASRLSGGTATCLLALVVMGADAEATSYKVTTTADHAPGKCTKGDCTLREATIRANAHDGSDRVRLPGSDRPYRLTRPGADEDAGRKGDLDLGDSMLIQGKSVSRTVIVQRTDDRVFHVDSSAIFGSSAERLTIKGGLVEDGSGGGVLAEGEFFLGKTRIVGNEARNGGGAAAVGGDGRLNVVESTVSGNRAELHGGGVFVSGTNGDDTGIFKSLVEGNRAPQGGGVYHLPGAAGLNVGASTITANQSLGEPTANGGGLFVESLFAGSGSTKMGAVTIASNEAPSGAGSNIHDELATQLENTLIGPDLGGGDSCDLDIDSAGHNLDQGTTCGLDQGTDLEDAEGELKELADNGGPTRTRALKGSSDAIEEGTCPGTIIQSGIDQRGAGRPSVVLGLSCDIGAFERNPTSPPDGADR